MQTTPGALTSTAQITSPRYHTIRYILRSSPPKVIRNISQHIFERRICYIFASVFTRCSVLAYYLRIFPPGLASLRRLSWALLALTIAQWAEVFTVLIFYCQDIGKLWTRDYLTFSGSRCFSSSTYSYSASIGDCVLDCMIFALPIPYVWSLSKLKARQRIGLIIIFALGFIVCVVALLQIPFIKRRADNASYFGGAINLLIAIQLSLAIIAASLPDIRALVARSFPNFSPLHHRSLNTQANNHGPRQEFRHAEEGQPVTENSDHARAAFEGRRNFRKPDWMRDTLPQSLMSTTITQTEMRRGSEYTIGGRRGSSWTIPTVPTLPEQSLIEELPTPSSSNTGRVLAEAERDTKKIPKVI